MVGGRGAVPLYNLMEDAATAEISRTQVWHWLRKNIQLEDGEILTRNVSAVEKRGVREN